MNDTPLTQLDDNTLQRLDDILQRITPTDDALDLSALDGFLVGVALQPKPIPEAQWLPFLFDADGRAWPAQARVHAGITAAQRDVLAQGARLRLIDLQRAVAQRQWFDPWLLADPEEHHNDADAESDDAPDDDSEADFEDDDSGLSNAVVSWVAGFSLATNAFPGLLAPRRDMQPVFDALALLYRHLDPDDVELEPELADAIEALDPPMKADDMVEDLVCGTLLLADISQPIRAAGPTGGAGRKPNGASRGKRGPPHRRS